MSQNGKGSKSRITNMKKYQDNFDKITWAKKEFLKNKKKKNKK